MHHPAQPLQRLRRVVLPQLRRPRVRDRIASINLCCDCPTSLACEAGYSQARVLSLCGPTLRIVSACTRVHGTVRSWLACRLPSKATANFTAYARSWGLPNFVTPAKLAILAKLGRLEAIYYLVGAGSPHRVRLQSAKRKAGVRQRRALCRRRMDRLVAEQE